MTLVSNTALAMLLTLLALLITGMPRWPLSRCWWRSSLRLAGSGPSLDPADHQPHLYVRCLCLSVPMFVMMASLLDRSGIARDLFDAITPDQWPAPRRCRGADHLHSRSCWPPCRASSAADRAAGPAGAAADAAHGL